MERYLVESNHSVKECHHIMEQFITHGFIRNFDWGCEAGVHTGWAIVEADDASLALMSVPPGLRPKARAILVRKVTPEKIQAEHE